MFPKYIICRLLAVSLFIVTPGFADAQLLPPAIEACVDGGSCTQPIPLAVIDPTGAVSAFSYTDSGIDKVLMRYEVEGTLESTFGNTETFRDVLWLGVHREYDINSFDRHEVTLFGIGSDAAIPNPLGLPDQLTVSLSTDGLLQGRGDTSLVGLLENPPPVAVPTLYDFPVITCRAVGCYGQAALNLIGMQFPQQDGSASFDLQPMLDDEVLLTRTSGFLGDAAGAGAFSDTLTVRISAAPQVVPEPSSIFATFGASAFFICRRRRTSSCKAMEAIQHEPNSPSV